MYSSTVGLIQTNWDRTEFRLLIIEANTIRQYHQLKQIIIV